MNFELFQQIIGLPLLVAVAILTITMTALSFWLTIRVKNDSLIASFLPICAAPFLVALFATLFSLISSVGVQLAGDEELLRDPAFFLTLNMIPLVFGASASAIPMTVLLLGRWSLAWKSSGLTIRHSNTGSSEESFDPQAWVERDTEDYLEQLSRPR